MLSNAMVSPTLPVVNLKRARKFYEEKLGLKVVAEDPSPGLMLEAGHGSMIYLYQREPSQCDHTLAGFYVENFDAEMKELRAKGVKFEDYDIPSMGIKTVNGVANFGGMKGAWFKDTEGNILSIGEWSVEKMKASTKAGASTSR
jgi:catechol 2,3-dioxygenase-like lactoylglutathione lyase family enzyme